jgi:hypothetical protein
MLTFRVAVRMFDIEGTRHLYDPVGNWYFLNASKLLGGYANLIMMINNFQLSKIRILITALIIILCMSSALIGIYDLDYILSNNVLGFLGQFISVYALGVFQIYTHKNITREIIDSMVGRIEEKSKFESIVEHLKESLIILNKNSIELVNTMFLHQFDYHIENIEPEEMPIEPQNHGIL